MDMLTLLVLVSLLKIGSLKQGLMGKKTWILNFNYNNTENWDMARLPCLTDRVIFEEKVLGPVELPPSHVSMRELVLPDNGEIIIPSDGEVVLSGKKTDSSCAGGEVRYLGGKVRGGWVEVRGWAGGPAVPHLERIPCQHDIPVFPSPSFFVLLPPWSVTVARFIVGNKEMYGKEWEDYLNSETGKRQFTREDREGDIVASGEGCRNPEGCECGNDAFKEYICDSQPTCTSFLPCFQPIVPEGYCCPICGGFAIFNWGEGMEMGRVMEAVGRWLEGERVHWYLSRIPSNSLQLVLTDSSPYSGVSSRLLPKLYHHLLSLGELHLVGVERWNSGEVLSPGSPLLNATLLLGSLLSVLSLLLALTLYYYPGQRFTWRGLLEWSEVRVGRRSMFARFEYQSGEVELSREPQEEETIRCFHNPMFATQEETRSLFEDAVYSEIKRNTNDVEVAPPEQPSSLSEVTL